MRTQKVELSILLSGFAVMVIGIHETGRFFPWAHYFVFLFGLTGVALAIAREIHLPATAAIIVVAATSYRIFVYMWPASMIGVDPDAYAATLHRVIETGTTATAAFYTDLSVTHLFNGSIAIVTGVRGRAVLIGVPLAFGVLLPLGAIVLARRISTDDSLSALAGTLGAVTGIGILFSYWPIAQALAILVWIPILLLLVIAADTGDIRAIIGAIVCLPALTYSHKISLLVPTAIIGAAVVTHFAETQVGEVVQSSGDRQYIHLLSAFLLLTGVLFSLQWLYITNYVQSAVFKLAPLAAGQGEVVPVAPQYEAATPGLPKIPGIIVRRAHYLSLLPFVTIAGFMLWLRDKSTPVLLLVAASAVPLAFVGISIIGPSIAPSSRMLIFGVVPFAVLLVRGAQDLPGIISANRTVILAVLFIPILLLQAGTVPAAPDYPNQPRYYLSAGEVDAKLFILENSKDAVAMDSYYAGESVDVSSARTAPTDGGETGAGTVGLDQRLVNNSLENGGHDAILLRDNADVIRFSIGKYRLLWNPVGTLNINSSYSRLYDNDHAVGFNKR
jgi:hypothetical protein